MAAMGPKNGWMMEQPLYEKKVVTEKMENGREKNGENSSLLTLQPAKTPEQRPTATPTTRANGHFDFDLNCNAIEIIIILSFAIVIVG